MPKDMVKMRQLWIQVNKGPEAIGTWPPTESPFPFNDNLTTLMLIVASDLNEVQRETHTRPLSLWNMKITAYILDAEQTVFVELFCTPKSSMENPALRVSGHGGSTNRVTKAILMTRNHVSGRGTIMSMHGIPKKIRTAKLKVEKL